MQALVLLALVALPAVHSQTVRPQPIPKPREFRTDCYDGSELIFTGDEYANNGKLNQTDKWGVGGLPGRYGQCKICPAGTATMDGFRCIPCPPGFYSEEGARECTACAAGKFSQPTDLRAYGTIAVTAASGMVVVSQPLFANASSCVNCPRGYYQPSPAGGYCIPCPPGTYTTGTGATVCIPCSEGTWIGAPLANTSIDSCPGGSACTTTAINPDTAAAYTVSNDQGDVIAKDGADEASSLQYYVSYPNRPNTCLNCPNNFFNPFKGAAVGATPQQACRRCPDGTWSIAGSSSANACSACPAGSFRNNFEIQRLTKYEEWPNTKCWKCPKGYYAPKAGMSRCLPCPAGTVAGSEGMQECVKCGAGLMSIHAVNPNVNLPNGGGVGLNYTGDDLGNATITGTPVILAAQAECRQVPAGYYTPEAGISIALPCAKGTYTNETGQDNCRTCSPGQYGPFFADNKCYGCNDGMYQPDRGQSFCFSCAAGGYANVTWDVKDPTNVTEAELAKNQIGYSTCTPCGLGYYQNLTKQIGCLPCEPGTYADITGSKTCKKCQAGRYQPSFGQFTCPQCSKGFYSNYGSSQCTPCSNGTMTPADGTARCTTCSPGFYANAASAATACVACPVGYYAPYRGTYANGANDFGPLGCFKCPFDTFTNRPGSSNCTTCPTNSTSGDGLNYCTATDGATRCVPCGLLKPAARPPLPPSPPPPLPQAPPSPLPLPLLPLSPPLPSPSPPSSPPLPLQPPPLPSRPFPSFPWPPSQPRASQPPSPQPPASPQPQTPYNEGVEPINGNITTQGRRLIEGEVALADVAWLEAHTVAAAVEEQAEGEEEEQQ